MEDNKTLSQKIKELDDRIEWFYSDDFELEKATDKYREATKLAEELQKDLNDLKNEIEVLKENFSK